MTTPLYLLPGKKQLREIFLSSGLRTDTVPSAYFIDYIENKILYKVGIVIMFNNCIKNNNLSLSESVINEIVDIIIEHSSPFNASVRSSIDRTE